jgi:hypothetical protein
MIKYLSPLVCKEIAKMLLEKEVEGDILLKDGTTLPNGFIDVKDGSTQPFKIESNDCWYTRNLRYIHSSDKQDRAIIGFENTKDNDELTRRVRLIDGSFCNYDFNRDAKLIEINWLKPDMYTKDYRFNKKARVLIGKLAKEGKIKGKIILANGETVKPVYDENEDGFHVGWWYSHDKGRWQTSEEKRVKGYEFAGFVNSKDLETLSEAYN